MLAKIDERDMYRSIDYFTALIFGPNSEIATQVRNTSGREELRRILETHHVSTNEFDGELYKIVDYFPFKIPGTNPHCATPEFILHTLKQNISTIEGPYSCTILTPTAKMREILNQPEDIEGRLREPPVLLLLGDIHFGNKPCSTPCSTAQNCYSFNEDLNGDISFLNLLEKLSATKFQTDIFIEQWIHQTKGEEQITLNYTDEALQIHSFQLIMINHLIKLNLQNSLQIKYPHLRIHSSDVRFKQQDINALVNVCLYNSNTFQTFVDRCSMIFSDLFLPLTKEQKEHVANELLQMIEARIRLGAEGFFRSPWFRENQFVAMYSPIYIQVKQLPVYLQNLLYENYTIQLNNRFESNFDTYITDFDFPSTALDTNINNENRFQIIHDYIKNLLDKYKDLREVSFFFLGIIASLDLYFLARSWKSPWLAWPSQLSVGYFGDMHVQTMVPFLLKNDLYKLRFIKYLPYDPSSLTWFESVSKCLEINLQEKLDDVLAKALTEEANHEFISYLMRISPTLVRHALTQHKDKLNKEYVVRLLNNKGIKSDYIAEVVSVMNDRTMYEKFKGAVVRFDPRWDALSELIPLHKQFYPERREYFTLLPLLEDGSADESTLNLWTKSSTDQEKIKLLERIYDGSQFIDTSSLEHLSQVDIDVLKTFMESFDTPNYLRTLIDELAEEHESLHSKKRKL
jgi:hypothetical protein